MTINFNKKFHFYETGLQRLEEHLNNLNGEIHYEKHLNNLNGEIHYEKLNEESLSENE